MSDPTHRDSQVATFPQGDFGKQLGFGVPARSPLVPSTSQFTHPLLPPLRKFQNLGVEEYTGASSLTPVLDLPIVPVDAVDLYYVMGGYSDQQFNANRWMTATLASRDPNTGTVQAALIFGEPNIAGTAPYVIGQLRQLINRPILVAAGCWIRVSFNAPTPHALAAIYKVQTQRIRFGVSEVPPSL